MANKKIWGYIRVSTNNQNTENQRLAILDYANGKRMKVDNWIEVKASTRKSPMVRKIDELVSRMKSGDILIVSELSRLGRSVGQIAILVDVLLNNKIKIICIKESLEISEHKRNVQTKVMTTMFSLFAEIERDLISERTKEGLARAMADGKLLGRPKGSLGKSKLFPSINRQFQSSGEVKCAHPDCCIWVQSIFYLKIMSIYSKPLILDILLQLELKATDESLSQTSCLRAIVSRLADTMEAHT